MTGEYVVPLLGGKTSKRLIAECKAYKKPVDVPTWLKFLGKIFTEEMKSGEKVSGCLIALSGINGNCQGAYDDLKAKRNDITVIAGEALLTLLEEIYSIRKASEIEQVVRRLTEQTIRLMDVAYYDNAVYWIVAFQGDRYAIIDSSGKTLEQAKASRLVKLIKKSEALGTYLDLEEEARANQLAMEARKLVLSRLIIGEGSASIAELSHAQVPPQFVEGAIAFLIEQGMVVRTDDRVSIVEPAEGMSYKPIAQMYVQLLLGSCPLDVLGKPYYDKHINDRLLAEIIATQKGIPLDDVQKDKVKTLVKLSPTALIQSLVPIPVIVNHRKEGEVTTDVIDKADVDFFFQTLHQCLRQDFQQGPLAEYFHERRGQVELDTTMTVKLKSKESLTFQDEVRERVRIGELAPEMTKGVRTFVRMIAINDGPEPWEWAEWTQKKAEEASAPK